MDVFGGSGETAAIPHINRATEAFCLLDPQSIADVSAVYEQDIGLARSVL